VFAAQHAQRNFKIKIYLYLTDFYHTTDICSLTCHQNIPLSKDMTEASNLNVYKSTRLPKRLWRVTHSETQSRIERPNGDLVASDSTRVITNTSGLKDAVKAYIDWRSRLPSCFLSVFNNERHARNLAAQRERTQSPVYIHPQSTFIPSLHSYH